MTAVMILTVDPVCGHFITFMVLNYSNCSMLKTGIHGFAEDGLHFLRFRGGGDVPVSRFPIKKCVADTSADSECFVTMFSDLTDDPVYLMGHFYAHGDTLLSSRYPVRHSILVCFAPVYDLSCRFAAAYACLCDLLLLERHTSGSYANFLF